jgi:hypothetical protein
VHSASSARARGTSRRVGSFRGGAGRAETGRDASAIPVCSTGRGGRQTPCGPADRPSPAGVRSGVGRRTVTEPCMRRAGGPAGGPPDRLRRAPSDHSDRPGRPEPPKRAPGERNDRLAVTRRIPWRRVTAGWSGGGRSGHPTHGLRAATPTHGPAGGEARHGLRAGRHAAGGQTRPAGGEAPAVRPGPAGGRAAGPAAQTGPAAARARSRTACQDCSSRFQAITSTPRPSRSRSSQTQRASARPVRGPPR